MHGARPRPASMPGARPPRRREVSRLADGSSLTSPPRARRASPLQCHQGRDDLSMEFRPALTTSDAGDHRCILCALVRPHAELRCSRCCVKLFLLLPPSHAPDPAALTPQATVAARDACLRMRPLLHDPAPRRRLPSGRRLLLRCQCDVLDLPWPRSWPPPPQAEVVRGTPPSPSLAIWMQPQAAVDAKGWRFCYRSHLKMILTLVVDATVSRGSVMLTSRGSTMMQLLGSALPTVSL
jgi:hypothetical protein